jgi:signal peptidase I
MTLDQPPISTESSATEQEQKAVKTAPVHTGWRKLWHEWVRPILTVIIVLYAFRTTVMDWNDVPSGSMEPTIHPGDRIVVNKLSYDLTIPYTNIKIWRYSAPKRGDIVVFISPEKDRIRLVKRVIGVPGDRISMEQKQLTINGQPLRYEWSKDIEVISTGKGKLEEFRRGVEYLPGHEHALMIYMKRDEPVHMTLDEIVVPEGQYFMMGDNRDDSKDSRYYGLVDRDEIEGRAFAVALSFTDASIWKPNWGRWFSKLK